MQQQKASNNMNSYGWIQQQQPRTAGSHMAMMAASVGGYGGYGGYGVGGGVYSGAGGGGGGGGNQDENEDETPTTAAATAAPKPWYPDYIPFPYGCIGVNAETGEDQVGVVNLMDYIGPDCKRKDETLLIARRPEWDEYLAKEARAALSETLKESCGVAGFTIARTGWDLYSQCQRYACTRAVVHKAPTNGTAKKQRKNGTTRPKSKDECCTFRFHVRWYEASAGVATVESESATAANADTEKTKAASTNATPTNPDKDTKEAVKTKDEAAAPPLRYGPHSRWILVGGAGCGQHCHHDKVVVVTKQELEQQRQAIAATKKTRKRRAPKKTKPAPSSSTTGISTIGATGATENDAALARKDKRRERLLKDEDVWSLGDLQDNALPIVKATCQWAKDDVNLRRLVQTRLLQLLTDVRSTAETQKAATAASALSYDQLTEQAKTNDETESKKRAWSEANGDGHDAGTGTTTAVVKVAKSAAAADESESNSSDESDSENSNFSRAEALQLSRL